MKLSERGPLTFIAALLFITALTIPAQAGPVTEVKNSAWTNSQRIMDPPEPMNERFDDVKSAGKNRGWAFAFGHDKHPILVTGFADHNEGVVPNPEPATLLLLATGLAGLGSIARSRRKH